MSGVVYDAPNEAGARYASEKAIEVETMLDVHAPEHGIHNVREFFLHLFTITCGLLIALGLENAAESWHHRQERKEAETLIREEITENRKGLLEAKPRLVAEIKGMHAMLVFVTARSKDEPATLPSGATDFNESTIPDSAWRTASSTGVVQWLPYAEVQRFADAYKEQGMLQAAAEQALNDYFELGSFAAPAAGGKFDLSPEVAKEALPIVRRTLAHLNTMYALGLGTVEAYDTATK